MQTATRYISFLNLYMPSVYSLDSPCHVQTTVFYAVLFRSLQTTFKVKVFTELWWLLTRPSTQMPWPKLWGSLATNTCCIDTCTKSWNPSPSLTGRIKNPSSQVTHLPLIQYSWVLSVFFFKLNIENKFPSSYVIIEFVEWLIFKINEYVSMFVFTAVQMRPVRFPIRHLWLLTAFPRRDCLWVDQPR